MRQWAISIGINQYQSFQPLSYAKQDAQAMQRFLVEDAGIPAEQCLLLTETSPNQWGKSTYPDRQTIQSWLDLLIRQYIQPNDTLWFFFSGQGMCQHGQDYLMPIEGDPAAVSATAIPLEAIFRSLSQVAAAKILVLLDVNRNESSFSYETVGNHTVHLASITGIPTILSCEPQEFSRETSALGHGFFTASLLESLRSRQSLTVDALAQYLSQHLPALNEHYWRPIQQAVTICPDEKRQQPLLPLAMVATTEAYANTDRTIAAQTALQNGSTAANGASVATAVKVLASETTPYQPGSATNGDGRWQPVAPNGQSANGADKVGAPGLYSASSATAPNGAANVSTGFSTNGLSAEPPTGSALANGQRQASALDSSNQNYENRVQPVQVPAVPQPHSDPPEETNEIPDALFWRPLLLWGGFAVVALILGVLLRNCASFTPKAPSAGQLPTAVRPTPSTAGQTGTGAAGTEPARTAAPIASSPATAPLKTGAPATVKPLVPQTIASAQSFGVSGASRLDPAITGKPNTTAQTKSTPAAVKPTIASSTPSPLIKAKALVLANKNKDASPYADAIELAKTVKPGQKDYAEAKQRIAQWSSEIMRIATQRGVQGRYDAAIAAAQLVPSDQPDYTKAKASSKRWCQALDRQKSANADLLRKARTICRS